MLNASDPQSIISLRRMKEVAAAGTKPFVVWIGAGSSRWLGYPGWKELTLQLRKHFFGSVAGFDNKTAVDLINREEYPAIFQMCRDLDSARYLRFIADAFPPKSASRAYENFLRLLRKIDPLFILTTNVDEALEKSLPSLTTVQRTDFSRCSDLLQRRVPFVAKLHGSVSSIQSTVFSTSDYQTITNDFSYLQTLKYIFSSCTVVFVGYGVRDEYVIRLLNEDTIEKDLFGPGPHFAVTNSPVSVTSLHRIGYSIRLLPDHTAACQILEYVAQSVTPRKEATVAVEEPALEKDEVSPTGAERIHAVEPGKTAYYISDLNPPGTWQTSQEITGKGEGGEIEASFGLGFTNDEVPSSRSSALHDLVVGLICFDFVYLPSSAMFATPLVLGAELFEELVKTDVLRFIHDEAKIGVLFHKDGVIGSIGNVIGGTEHGPDPRPISDIIRKTFQPIPGKESAAEDIFRKIEQQTAIYRKANEIDLPSLVCGALVMPGVSKLLGIGDAIFPTQAPRWLRYPYLRLGHLVQTAALCREYGIQAAKVPFGGVQLTTAAFGIEPAQWQADHLASYALAGAFNSDLGAYVQQDMSIIKDIIRFRASSAGEAFRRETAQVLTTGSGAEFNASVNAGLSKTIPVAVLVRARDGLLRLMTESPLVTPVPAVWGNAVQSDSTTRLWRLKCRRMLIEMCAARGIGNNDPCICGSGERLRLCCLFPLSN